MLVIVLLFGITLLDQWSKWLVQHRLEFGESVTVIPGLLNLRHVRNTGAAWGMFADYLPLLVTISLAVLILFLFRGRTIFGDNLTGRLTLGLLSAGICGNLIDRLRWGYVLDFLDFHWRGWHFPAFNVADMAITSGVFLYLLVALLKPQCPGEA